MSSERADRAARRATARDHPRPAAATPQATRPKLAEGVGETPAIQDPKRTNPAAVHESPMDQKGEGCPAEGPGAAFSAICDFSDSGSDEDAGGVKTQVPVEAVDTAGVTLTEIEAQPASIVNEATTNAGDPVEAVDTAEVTPTEIEAQPNEATSNAGEDEMPDLLEVGNDATSSDDAVSIGTTDSDLNYYQGPQPQLAGYVPPVENFPRHAPQLWYNASASGETIIARTVYYSALLREAFEGKLNVREITALLTELARLRGGRIIVPAEGWRLKEDIERMIHPESGPVRAFFFEHEPYPDRGERDCFPQRMLLLAGPEEHWSPYFHPNQLLKMNFHGDEFDLDEHWAAYPDRMPWVRLGREDVRWLRARRREGCLLRFYFRFGFLRGWWFIKAHNNAAIPPSQPDPLMIHKAR